MIHPPALLDPRPAHGHAVLVTLAGLAVSVVLAFLSDGSIQDDGLAHFLYARWAWHDADALLDVWGRPGMTALYALPARLGWTACRLESGLLSAATAWLAYLTACRMKLARAGLVPLLVFAQPLFLALSYDTFTETAVAFYMALGAWLFATARFSWSAAALSLCLVTRFETAPLAIVWIVGLAKVSARWHAFAALTWAPLAYGLLGQAVMGRWPHEILLEGPHLSEYGQGTPLSMWVKSLVACGPAVGILAMVGALTREPREEIQNSKFKIQNSKALGWVLAAAYLVHLTTQSVLYGLGVFSSGGYARFFVSTAPLAAILALRAVNSLASPGPRATLALLAGFVALGWMGIESEPAPRDEVWLLVYHKVRPLIRGLCVAAMLMTGWLLVQRPDRPSRGARWGRRTLVLTAAASMIGPWFFLVRPHRQGAEARDVAAAVRWLREHGLADGPVITTHVWTSYFLGATRNITALPGRNPLEGAAAGAVLLWDARYSPSERFNLSRDKVEADGHWRLLWSSNPDERGCVFTRIYRQTD